MIFIVVHLVTVWQHGLVLKGHRTSPDIQLKLLEGQSVAGFTSSLWFLICFLGNFLFTVVTLVIPERIFKNLPPLKIYVKKQ